MNTRRGLGLSHAGAARARADVVIDLDQTFPTADGEPAGLCIQCDAPAQRTTQHGNPACDAWPDCTVTPADQAHGAAGPDPSSGPYAGAPALTAAQLAPLRTERIEAAADLLGYAQQAGEVFGPGAPHPEIAQVALSRLGVTDYELYVAVQIVNLPGGAR
jgi:hypothetical protein